MSAQAESRHFFQVQDTVQRADGSEGVVFAASPLYAMVRWSDGAEEELDQFDPSVSVISRGGKA